jgi:hypothetical protein
MAPTVSNDDSTFTFAVKQSALLGLFDPKVEGTNKHNFLGKNTEETKHTTHNTINDSNQCTQSGQYYATTPDTRNLCLPL